MAGEEDMELYFQVDQQPAPSLAASPTLKFVRSPTSTLANPLSLPPNRTLPYVTNMVSVGATSGVVAAFSSPEDTFAAFELGRGKLEKVRQWIGHEGGITCVLGSEETRSGASVIGSCGKDGVVRSWDIRSGSVGAVYQGKEGSHTRSLLIYFATLTLFSSPALNFNKTRPLLSMNVSCDGQTIAAGTETNGEDAPIVFW
jgi:WD40 repeat protein